MAHSQTDTINIHTRIRDVTITIQRWPIIRYVFGIHPEYVGLPAKMAPFLCFGTTLRLIVQPADFAAFEGGVSMGQQEPQQEASEQSRPMRKVGLAKPHDHSDLVSHLGGNNASGQQMVFRGPMQQPRSSISCPEGPSLNQRPDAQRLASAASIAPVVAALRPSSEGRQLQLDFAATRCAYEANRARGLIARGLMPDPARLP